MEAPKYDPPPAPAADPAIAALTAKAKAYDIKAMQDTAEIDTASLMARFGTRMAMGGSSTASPLVGA